MRADKLLRMTAGVAFLAETGIPRAEHGKETKAERVAALIRQLGHDTFAEREEADKELEAIGRPALPAWGEAWIGTGREVPSSDEEGRFGITPL